MLMIITSLLPFPRLASLNKKSQAIVQMGLLAGIFLLLFKPFGIVNETGEWFIYLIIGGFGAVFIISVFIMVWLTEKIIPRFFKTWGLIKAVLWYLLLIVIAGLNNYLYKSFWMDFKDFSWQGYVLVTGRTAAILLLVYILWLGLRKYKVLLRRKYSEQRKIITAENGDSFELRLNDVLFLKSDDNYVDVYLKTARTYRVVTIRSSLKFLESQFSSPLSSIQRCHRSYLVNLSRVRMVGSSSRSMSLYCVEVDKYIPISRRHTNSIKNRLTTHPKILSFHH